MSEVEESSLPDRRHYFLPHHAVLKESSSTTKLRVVFDASFKSSSGVSLNDVMMVGPPLQQNVCDIILRWRMYQYTFTADIEKMYRQIWVSEQDRNYQLILWRSHFSDPIKIYRLKTVTFGTAAAPYLAIRTLQKLAEDTKNHQASKMIMDEMYVDDLISGAHNMAEARIKIKEIKATLETAGFRLRKWTSNADEILTGIPAQDRESTFSLPSSGEPERVKTLGVSWLPTVDQFSFCYKASDDPEPTKRSVLSAIARLFDPMGWIAPCTVKAKIFMQQLWVRKMKCNEQLEPSLLEKWQIFYEDLRAINKITFPRWVDTSGDFTRTELHGFSDASEKAYSAAIYLRVKDDDDQAKMHLLIAKSKVAPIEPVSLPRLELCGAVMLAKLLSYAEKTLGYKGIKMFAWTDSTITLSWILASPTKWETFLRNRVGEIQRLTSGKIWKHIPTQQNPADLVSRGVLPSALVDDTLWWNGPVFLRTAWNFKIPPQPSKLIPESESHSIQSHHIEVKDLPLNELIHYASDFTQLVRTVGIMMRFINNSRRNPLKWNYGPISPKELDIATRILARLAQSDMFPDGTSKTRGMESLYPFVDAEGLIRVGGRLKNANLKYDQQHPIILQPHHHFTKLIIREAHEKTLHGGIQLMMGYIRLKFWIFQSKQAVKKYVHCCVICHRYRSKTSLQLMGDLPAPRVTVTRPFCHTGVDYAGPINIRAWKGRGAKCYKGYIAIFVCLATKAMHLEAVSELTTQAFLTAFRRFAARRGVSSHVYSDCGTNFKGAEVELLRLMKNAMHDWKEVAYVLASEGTKWNFIPPAALHFGGLWEAGVKSVKHHFKRIVGNGTLTFEELTTLLTQIEACLNSRPLCPLTENPDDFQALTPAHFLIGEQLFTVPEPDLELGKTSYVDR